MNFNTFLSNDNNNIYFSRISFIFLVYIVITSGYINELLSCQMRGFLKKSLFSRHVKANILIFALIMFEVGWSLKHGDEVLDSNNNWSSGNVRDTLLIATGLYFIFIISSKSRLLPNMVFFGLMFIVYFINTDRAYKMQNNKIDKKTNLQRLQLIF